LEQIGLGPATEAGSTIGNGRIGEQIEKVPERPDQRLGHGGDRKIQGILDQQPLDTCASMITNLPPRKLGSKRQPTNEAPGADSD
jgi:hypothetical protein